MCSCQCLSDTRSAGKPQDQNGKTSSQPYPSTSDLGPWPHLYSRSDDQMIARLPSSSWTETPDELVASYILLFVT
jgi:hypothetical protein